MHSPSDDFFVPDEPLADALAAYEAGAKGVTKSSVTLTLGTRSEPARLTSPKGTLRQLGTNVAVVGKTARFSRSPGTFKVSASKA